MVRTWAQQSRNRDAALPLTVTICASPDVGGWRPGGARGAATNCVEPKGRRIVGHDESEGLKVGKRNKNSPVV
ncbi:MAG: hypothetical protein ACYSYV_11870 [Planctomycetota bacterium]